MNIETLARKYRDAGYSLRRIWEAKEGGSRHANVVCYTVYAPSGHLLTSVVLREIKTKTHADCFSFWINEGASVADDLEYLEGLRRKVECV